MSIAITTPVIPFITMGRLVSRYFLQLLSFASDEDSRFDLTIITQQKKLVIGFKTKSNMVELLACVLKS
jgi:hypothetical protein